MNKSDENKSMDKLSVKEKQELLPYLRAAVFFQIELSNTASSIRESLNASHEGDWDIEYRLKQVRLEFGEGIVNDDDVERFVSDLEDSQFPQPQAFSAVLDKQRKAIIRQKLQKAVWIQNELWKTAGLMVPILRGRTEDVVVDIQEFSTLEVTGCELVQSDLDLFLGDFDSLEEAGLMRKTREIGLPGNLQPVYMHTTVYEWLNETGLRKEFDDYLQAKSGQSSSLN